MSNNQETKTEEKTSTGRYSVGEKIYGISFQYESQSGKNRGYRQPFIFGELEKPSQIDIVELTVTEHHKVSSDWDEQDKKNYDGYKLQDDKGQVWHNQYPTASYGQTTDTADRMFEIHVTDRCEIEKLLKGTEPWQVYSVTSLYTDIARGVDELVKPDNRRKTDDEAWYDKRLELLKELKSDIENKMKELGLVFKTVAIWDKHPDITKSILVKES
jgi:hypothetical protein